LENIKKVFDAWILKSTPDKPLWNIEHILEGHKPKWNYVDGCMLKSIMDLYYATNDMKYFDFVKNFVDYYVDADGTILGYNEEDYNCDNVNEGKVLFDLYKKTKNEKYKKAITNIYKQLEKQPRTKEGNFWHKQIYENQIWLDGLYMVMPFYMEYEIEFNNSRYYNDIIKQFTNVYDIMRDKNSGLYFHGYDSEKKMFWADNKTGLSPNFWSRSMGWFAMALVDTLEKTDKMFLYEYELLQKYLRELIDSLLVLIKSSDTKMFYQVPNLPSEEGNYLETSGSCAIAYTILKAVRLKFLPDYYYEYGLEIFNAIVESKLSFEDDNFILKDICLVAGLGGMPGKGDYKLRDGTLEYYFSEPIVTNDAKGLAPFIFTFAEVLRRAE